jgi:hypothetical protein
MMKAEVREGSFPTEVRVVGGERNEELDSEKLL